MKIKVRGKVYDGDREPVMVILTPQDRLNIHSMTPDATKYCAYPEEKMSQDEALCWMRDIPEAEKAEDESVCRTVVSIENDDAGPVYPSDGEVMLVGVTLDCGHRFGRVKWAAPIVGDRVPCNDCILEKQKKQA